MRLFLGRSCGLGRKLKYRCFLTVAEHGQRDDAPIRKLGGRPRSTDRRSRCGKLDDVDGPMRRPVDRHPARRLTTAMRKAIRIRRREFIVTLGGISAAWPFASHAKQTERTRRIGVLMLYPEKDPQGQLRATAFQEGLQKLGWVVGRNVQIDFQWGFGDADWIKSAAAQLLRLSPDMILANGTPAAKTMQQASHTVPVIFIAGSDPVVDGLDRMSLSL